SEVGAVAAASRDATHGRVGFRATVRDLRPAVERVDERAGEPGDAVESLVVDLVPGVAGLVVVRVRAGEQREHRDVLLVERRVVARAVAVLGTLEVEAAVAARAVDDALEL